MPEADPVSPRPLELSLPDLPEVPITLGPVDAGTPVERRRRRLRLGDVLGNALPLLLMGALALATWWLVRHAPPSLETRDARVPREEPDYVMQAVTLQRYTTDGRLRLQIEGRELRHLPLTDRIEIDEATVRAYTPDGRETVGTARRLIADAKGTDVLLSGGARIVGVTARGLPAEIEGEALRLFPKEERVRSETAVRLRIGEDTLEAGGVDYTQRTGQAELTGPMRAQLAQRAPDPRKPAVRKAPARKAPAGKPGAPGPR
jgi:lipopolysaccharide export system protein LptC